MQEFTLLDFNPYSLSLALSVSKLLVCQNIFELSHKKYEHALYLNRWFFGENQHKSSDQIRRLLTIMSIFKI